MGISIGLVGLGSFGAAFADLFRKHPAVDRVALCDCEPERMRAIAARPGWEKKFASADAFTDYAALLRARLDAVAIFTQPWLHAPQALAALEAGRHVYSAVPVIMLPDGDETLDWCDRIIRACRQSGKHYMLGETTYYHPETMFCRRQAAAGKFGDFVYAEGEYFHDLDTAGGSNLREVKRRREAGAAGSQWPARKAEYVARGLREGPMYYPTHSVSGPACVMDCPALKVTARGYRNRTNDPYFADHEFSNEVALFTMRNGAAVRICEFRECAGSFHDNETFRIMGTRGSYAERTWRFNGRTNPTDAQPLAVNTFTDEEMRDPLPSEVAAAWRGVDGESVDYGGHHGSHAYLVHEFVDAVHSGRRPAIHAWEAARYMAMGVTAHKSALRDGEILDVPDWGEPA